MIVSIELSGHERCRLTLSSLNTTMGQDRLANNCRIPTVRHFSRVVQPRLSRLVAPFRLVVDIYEGLACPSSWVPYSCVIGHCCA